jgi:hypothetical protein
MPKDPHDSGNSYTLNQDYEGKCDDPNLHQQCSDYAKCSQSNDIKHPKRVSDKKTAASNNKLYLSDHLRMAGGVYDNLVGEYPCMGRLAPNMFIYSRAVI